MGAGCSNPPAPGREPEELSAGVDVAEKRFATLLDAFKHCDPDGTGYIHDHARFVEVARAITGVSTDDESLWHSLDQDGNAAVNFPEFVEWAELAKVNLPIGLEDDADGVGAGVGGVAYPSTWRGPRSYEDYNHIGRVTDSAHLCELQELLDVSYRKVWTRDRKATSRNQVPDSYTLVSAEHTENYADWRRYYLKRHHILSDCRTGGCMEVYSPLTDRAVRLCRRHGLRSETCNEWLLFHGTTAAAAKAICLGDFTMRKAGSATGTLYGRGSYFAESITKADEYARDDDDGVCCMLVCRITGGHVLYNDEVEPDAQGLQDAVLKGQFHAILGDREKCRGTFKEYVVFDADQVYVEYILYYRRIYASGAR